MTKQAIPVRMPKDWQRGHIAARNIEFDHD